MPQSFEPLVDARFRSADCTPEGLGNFFVAELLAESKRDRFRLSARQFCDFGPNALLPFRFGKDARGVGHGFIFLGPFDITFDSSANSCKRSEVFPGKPNQDSMKPSRTSRSTVKGVPLSKGNDQSFLSEVIRGSSIAGQLPRGSVQSRKNGRDKFVIHDALVDGVR